MSFLYPVILSGVILAGIPVLLHLIMRQKPKHLLFPAFRFLLQRHRTNQRKLRLRHILLLALRLFLIIGICLALARPKIFSQRLNLAGDTPIAAVLVFDTSYSMGYVSGGLTRLEQAKQRARELIDEMPAESRVAILDTAEPGGEWISTLYQARERIGDLRLRPANGPVTSRLAEAYRLLADLDQESDNTHESMPRFLYVFSDRTQECWDPRRVHDLEQFRERLSSPAHAVFVDVGTETPVDIALLALELPRQVIPLGDPLILRVTVGATGDGCDTEVLCRLDGEMTADHRPIKLAAGQSQVVTFERRDLAAGFHHAEITLATTDALPFNNTMFATFAVRGHRQVLTLADDPRDAEIWKAALESKKAFKAEVRTSAEARAMSPVDLAGYQAVCLLGVAHPPHDLWEKLDSYVARGGGLAVVPGGMSVDLKKAYNDDDVAQRLLPGALVRIVKSDPEKGTNWKETTYRHPILAPFREWTDFDLVRFPPAAFRYWEVRPYPGAGEVVIAYADKEGRPALLERKFEQKKRGRSLLFTTRLDRPAYRAAERWNDYPGTSFYVVLVNLTVGYLAGDADESSLNYLSGQTPTVVLPASPRFPTYTLQGPGLSATEAVVNRAESQSELLLTQASTPGNYTLLGSDAKPAASFSVNVPPEESRLTRVPPEQIEVLLGEGSVLPVGHGTKLRDALQSHWSQPVELFPWLMILVLLVLAVENLLANKFYRREAPEETETPVPAPAVVEEVASVSVES